jgi:predicted transposase/invertase (TIGR01784 family)
MILTEYDYDTYIPVQQQKAYENGVEQGISQGITQVIQQKAIKTAKNILNMNLPIEQITTLTGISLNEINTLKNNNYE